MDLKGTGLSPYLTTTFTSFFVEEKESRNLCQLLLPPHCCVLTTTAVLLHLHLKTVGIKKFNSLGHASKIQDQRKCATQKSRPRINLCKIKAMSILFKVQADSSRQICPWVFLCRQILSSSLCNLSLI